jgi:hypothetical protein
VAPPMGFSYGAYDFCAASKPCGVRRAYENESQARVERLVFQPLAQRRLNQFAGKPGGESRSLTETAESRDGHPWVLTPKLRGRESVHGGGIVEVAGQPAVVHE